MMSTDLKNQDEKILTEFLDDVLGYMFMKHTEYYPKFEEFALSFDINIMTNITSQILCNILTNIETNDLELMFKKLKLVLENHLNEDFRELINSRKGN